MYMVKQDGGVIGGGKGATWKYKFQSKNAKNEKTSGKGDVKKESNMKKPKHD